MIEIIEGMGVGAGKSYFTVKRLIDHWRRGGTAYIVDTMHIKWSECKQLVERRYGLLLEDSQFNEVTEEQVTRIFEHTPPGTDDNPVLIVIDECQGSLNARDWNDKSKRDLFDWCTQSRHDCNDLWFISQSALNVDKQLRRLASYVWRIRNTKQWGSNIITIMCKVMKYMSCGLHSGAFFIISQLDQDNRTLIGRKRWIDQESEIFACYESRSMRGKRARAGSAVCRLKLAKKVAKRPYFRWAIAGALVMLCVAGCKAMKHLVGMDKKESKETVVAKAVDAKPAYDTRLETFRAAQGDVLLKTDRFTYLVHEMSPDGLVDGIHAGVIRVRQPNGRLLFIVTDYNGGNALASTGSAQESPSPAVKKEIYVAHDRGLFPPASPLFPHDITPYDKEPVNLPAPTPTATPRRPITLRAPVHTPTPVK